MPVAFVPVDDQPTVFAGLPVLHTLIGDIYQYFTNLIPVGDRWSDWESCYQAIEAPVKLLWALGIAGKNRSRDRRF